MSSIHALMSRDLPRYGKSHQIGPGRSVMFGTDSYVVDGRVIIGGDTTGGGLAIRRLGPGGFDGPFVPGDLARTRPIANSSRLWSLHSGSGVVKYSDDYGATWSAGVTLSGFLTSRGTTNPVSPVPWFGALIGSTYYLYSYYTYQNVSGYVGIRYTTTTDFVTFTTVTETSLTTSQTTVLPYFTWFDGKIVAALSSGSGAYKYSADGTSWSDASGVTFAGVQTRGTQLPFIQAYDGLSVLTQDSRILRTQDGVTWESLATNHGLSAANVGFTGFLDGQYWMLANRSSVWGVYQSQTIDGTFSKLVRANAGTGSGFVFNGSGPVLSTPYGILGPTVGDVSSVFLLS